MRRGFALVGFAANRRFGGIAVVIDGEPVHMTIARWKRGSDGPSPSRVSSLLLPALRRFHPVAVVVLVDDAAGVRSARSRLFHRETVAPALLSVPLPRIEVTKSDLARDLGLSRSTSVALRRELLRRTPLETFRGTNRTADARELERYWECAVLATGATQVPLRHPQVVHA